MARSSMRPFTRRVSRSAARFTRSMFVNEPARDSKKGFTTPWIPNPDLMTRNALTVLATFNRRIEDMVERRTAHGRTPSGAEFAECRRASARGEIGWSWL